MSQTPRRLLAGNEPPSHPGAKHQIRLVASRGVPGSGFLSPHTFCCPGGAQTSGCPRDHFRIQTGSLAVVRSGQGGCDDRSRRPRGGRGASSLASKPKAREMAEWHAQFPQRGFWRGKKESWHPPVMVSISQHAHVSVFYNMAPFPPRAPVGKLSHLLCMSFLAH